MLAAILSCTINPELPNKLMDSCPLENGKEPYPPSSGFTVPLRLIDPYGLLNYCPANEVGKNFYNVDDDLTVNTLYKSQDLNAFIWYVMNRGVADIQIEENKMMWDSRGMDSKTGSPKRTDVKTWNFWLNSKSDKHDLFYCSGSGEEQKYYEAYSGGTTILKYLHPIMQLKRDTETKGKQIGRKGT